MLTKYSNQEKFVETDAESGSQSLKETNYVKLKLFKHVIMSNTRIFFYTQTQNTCSKYNSKSSSFFGKSKILFIAIYLSVILQSPLPLFLLYLYSFRFFIWLIITSGNGENSNTCLNCQCLKIQFLLEILSKRIAPLQEPIMIKSYEGFCI